MVESRMVPLGVAAPQFSLLDPQGRRFSLGDFAGAELLLVVFACNHCPYVKHVRHGLARLASDLEASSVATVAINSNDTEQYPADSPPLMAEFAAEAGWTFPYLFDDTQEVARAYGAECTPDFFLFDGARRLVYRGQMDDSRPGNDKPVTGRDIRSAVEACLAGEPPIEPQVASIGCGIKWRKT